MIVCMFSRDFLSVNPSQQHLFQYLRCGMFHFAMLEGIVGAILAIVTALFSRQHQRKRRACCLLHWDIGQIGAYESVRGWIHFKHCSRRLVIDILVHSEWAHIRANKRNTQWTMENKTNSIRFEALPTASNTEMIEHNTHLGWPMLLALFLLPFFFSLS